MTCLARRPQKTGNRFCDGNTHDKYLLARTIMFGIKAPYTARAMPDVTKPRDNSDYSPYLPWAGLYSLLSDSFGPVP